MKAINEKIAGVIINKYHNGVVDGVIDPYAVDRVKSVGIVTGMALVLIGYYVMRML